MANRALIDPLRRLAEQHKNNPHATNPVNSRMEAIANNNRVEGLAHNVLKFVSQEQYPRAADQLKMFIDLHPEYPQFKLRIERYINYAFDLVNAIKAKRNLAGVKQLAAAKQQELYDKALSHFDDLRSTLKKIELIEHEVKLEDVRSTIWVLKAFGYCTFAILLFFFISELTHGVWQSGSVLADGYISQMVDKLFDYLGI